MAEDQRSAAGEPEASLTAQASMATKSSVELSHYYVWPRQLEAGNEGSESITKLMEDLNVDRESIHLTSTIGRPLYWKVPMTSEQAAVIEKHPQVSIF